MAEFKLVGMMRKRPPLVHVLFDVQFRNSGPGPRWFLLPDKLNSPWAAGGGGVDGVEVFEFTGKGRAVVGHFQGTQGFLALLVPAGAVLTIRRFMLPLWNEAPKGEVSIEVVMAPNLTIGGEDAFAWFERDPASEAASDVTTEGGRMLGTRHTPDRSEVTISTDVERLMTVRVPLGKPTL
jgi:hypothetical protein